MIPTIPIIPVFFGWYTLATRAPLVGLRPGSDYTRTPFVPEWNGFIGTISNALN